MAITTATLTAAITSTQVQFNLSNISGSGLPAAGSGPLSIGIPMQIDSEFMFVVNQPVAGTVVVRGRGSDGTAAAAHDILAPVYLSPTPSDFGAYQPGTATTLDPSDDIATSLGQDQTITVPGSNSAFLITKATAAALILPAPLLVDNAVTLVFTSATAVAHVITATSLLRDGTSGSPKTTATFAAQTGASMLLMAENGFWNVVSLQNVTLS